MATMNIAYNYITIFLASVTPLLMILLIIFLKKSVETMGENIFKKSYAKFQSELDKGNIKFSTNHQKQVDVLHDIYQKYQRMNSAIKKMIHGEKYTEQLDPEIEVERLISKVKEFKESFYENDILFLHPIKLKVDDLIPATDKFIEKYKEGIVPYGSEETKEQFAQENGGVYLGAIFRMDAFDEITQQLNTIKSELEHEFRKIYGTEAN